MNDFTDPHKTGMSKFGCLGPTFVIIAVIVIILFTLVMFVWR